MAALAARLLPPAARTAFLAAFLATTFFATVFFFAGAFLDFVVLFALVGIGASCRRIRRLATLRTIACAQRGIIDSHAETAAS